VSYTLTDAQIFNKALVRLGEQAGKVFAVDGTDTSEYGILASQEYQTTRNEELKENDWLFAINRVQMVENTVAVNNTGYSYVYDIPIDCLRVINVYSLSAQFTIYPLDHLYTILAPTVHEKGLLYTDLDPTADNPYMKYIQELPLGTLWTDSIFADALALRIASKIARAVTHKTDAALTNSLQGEYAYVIQKAKQKNAIDKEDDLPEADQGWWIDRSRY
jgi:hypothetical protein